MDLQTRRISGDPTDFVGRILAPGFDYETHVRPFSPRSLAPGRTWQNANEVPSWRSVHGFDLASLR